MCTDRHALNLNASISGANDTVDTVSNYETLSSNLINDTNNLTTIEVTFERLFNTNDTSGEDY